MARRNLNPNCSQVRAHKNRTHRGLAISGMEPNSTNAAGLFPDLFDPQVARWQRPKEIGLIAGLL
jgi:hypothetical protein